MMSFTKFGYIMDINGDIISTTDNFYEITGLKDNINYEDLENDLGHYTELWKALISTGNWNGIIQFKNSSGVFYWAEKKITKVHDIIDINTQVTFKVDVKNITKEIEIKQQNISGFYENAQSCFYKYAGVFKIFGVGIASIDSGLLHAIKTEDAIRDLFYSFELNNIRLYKTIGHRYVFLSNHKTDEEIKKDIKVITKVINRFLLKNGFDKMSLHCGLTEIDNNFSSDFEMALKIAHEIKVDHIFFKKDVPEISKEIFRLNWEKKAKDMIKAGDIFPLYQPIMDVNTLIVNKYEVLARGVINGEIITPDYFIDHAKNLGLITTITRTMISQSFEYFKNNHFDFSINITESDLSDETFFNFIEENLKKYNINPNRLILEILENIASFDQNPEINNLIKKFQEIGIKIAVDDFGADNSNFSRLLSLNMDFIKIDKIFIKNIEENEKNIHIVKMIVLMSKSLGIKTVAEYVSSKKIFNIIKECGVDFAQGYYIGKPEKGVLNEKI
jgi:EAL domain-containing protein (putative c-di-GMP-specific phosphodiesterase class I)